MSDEERIKAAAAIDEKGLDEIADKAVAGIIGPAPRLDPTCGTANPIHEHWMAQSVNARHFVLVALVQALRQQDKKYRRLVEAARSAYPMLKGLSDSCPTGDRQANLVFRLIRKALAAIDRPGAFWIDEPRAKAIEADIDKPAEAGKIAPGHPGCVGCHGRGWFAVGSETRRCPCTESVKPAEGREVPQ